MPKLKQFPGCRIAIYPRDHRPPHVHVEFRDGDRCTVEKLKRPLAWIAASGRAFSEMEGDRAMSQPPLVRAVKAKSPAALEITWSTGETLTVDVSRLIKRFKLYAPLKNAALFGKAKADPWGHAVNWPGEIDMGADQLYELAREQAGEWGPEHFSAWMEEHGLSLNTAADALGLSRRMIAHYRTGSRPIPRVVALACEGLSTRWKQRVA